jgi:hypothetical protein
VNAFREHHQNSIRFAYRCFDRILLNCLIQPFQQIDRVVGFFRSYRQLYPVNKAYLTGISSDYHTWIEQEAKLRNIPVLDDPKPKQRRDEFVEQYFTEAKPDDVVAIIKAREPARILIAIGAEDSWHYEYALRWVVHYNIYLNDARWGKMFVRMCPHFPFSARIYLNQHHWLANRMRAERIDFRQSTNAFLECAAPQRLQELADSLTAGDIRACAYKWLTKFTPFFTTQEWREANCAHRLFFSQAEYCDNLIFDQRAALDALEERVLDANRTIGRPDNITTVFGRRVTSHYQGKLQTTLQDLHIQSPLIRSHYGHGGVKQYVRDNADARTEAFTNDVRDYGVNKAIDNLPELRQKMSGIVDSYLNVQQDILETFVDRGQLRKLTSPTILPGGKRVPGLKLDHPRQLALMHALVRFAQIAAGDTFSSADLLPEVCAALGPQPRPYTAASLRYDLSKLRAKDLVQKVPHSRRYRLAPNGYALCVVFLKLFERIYAPLTAGLLEPVEADRRLPLQRRHALDRLYQRIVDDLERLIQKVGLKIAA